MALSGKVVFIAGGVGTVGSGIAKSMLKEGAKVGVSSRSQQRLDDFKKTLSKDLQKNLVLLKEDVATEDGAKNILQTLQKQHGGVDHVIASISGWWQGGTLTSQTVAEFDSHIKERGTSHFICCKTFLPVLAKQKGTTYTMLTGTGGEKCFSPDMSMVTVGAGCAFGISEAAQSEFKDSEVAFSEFRIGVLIQAKLQAEIENAQKSSDMSVWNESAGGAVGHDLIGDFMVDVIKARVRGQIRFASKKEIDAKRKEFQAIWKK